MGEEGCSDQIQHGQELSWGEALKEGLIVHWLLWTELKGQFWTLGSVVPTEACRSQIIYQSLLTLSKTGGVGGWCGPWATWRCFNLPPFAGDMWKYTLTDADDAAMSTCLLSVVANDPTSTWGVKDFYQSLKPLRIFFLLPPVTWVTGKAQLWRKVFIVWLWALSTNICQYVLRRTSMMVTHWWHYQHLTFLQRWMYKWCDLSHFCQANGTNHQNLTETNKWLTLFDQFPECWLLQVTLKAAWKELIYRGGCHSHKNNWRHWRHRKRLTQWVQVPHAWMRFLTNFFKLFQL